MRGWHWVLAEPRAGLCSRAGFGRDVVIHVPPSPCHHSLHGAQHCQACLHCPKLLWHPGVLPFAWAVRSSLWHGLTGLLAFPISDFYDINYSSVTAQLICIIKRCGGDWFYNNSSDLWSTFHPGGPYWLYSLVERNCCFFLPYLTRAPAAPGPWQLCTHSGHMKIQVMFS